MAYETAKIDLHIHTDVSDGTDTPQQLLSLVKAAGVALFAVTDHDSVRGCAAIRELRTKDDPAFLTGVEFSCKDEEGKYHILGYGFDPGAEPIRQVLDQGHAFRVRKAADRLAFLEENFGFKFSEEDLQALSALECPGKPHIGNLMVKYGYAKTLDEAISRYIDQKIFHNQNIRPEDAIAGILGSGGIPVLAHPANGSGRQSIHGEEMDRRIRRLTGFGLQGLEVFYSGFSPQTRAEMLAFAQRYGLYATAGSDYHGKNKTVALADTGLDETGERPECLQRFLLKAQTLVQSTT